MKSEKVKVAETKTCTKCGEDKAASEFCVHKPNTCKECERERVRIYRLMNLDACRKRERQYYHRNREKRRKYVLKNRIKLREQRLRYYNENKEKISQRKRIYRLDHPEKVKEVNLRSYLKNKPVNPLQLIAAAQSIKNHANTDND